MNINSFYELKRGNLKNLKGLLIVYAKIINRDSPDNQKNPVYEMAKNGLLAATGDYRTQNNIGDFLRKELGITLEDLSSSESVNIAGLPEGMNPDYIKNKLQSLKGFEEMIPTPSKLEYFDSEQEILSRDCDIFYLGEFERLANANLAVNALPILYQAIYREQVTKSIALEIEKMLLTAQSDIATSHYSDDLAAIENKLTSEYISELIYNRENPAELNKWKERLNNYMAGYKYPADVEKIIQLAAKSNSSGSEIRLLLELYVRKITAFLKEDYKSVGELMKEIEKHETSVLPPETNR
jgi:hypothetical protein